MKYTVTESGKKYLRFDDNNEVELTNTEAVAMKAMGHVTEPKPAEKISSPMQTQQMSVGEPAEGAEVRTLRRNRYNRADLRAVDSDAKDIDTDPPSDSA